MQSWSGRTSAREARSVAIVPVSWGNGQQTNTISRTGSGEDGLLWPEQAHASRTNSGSLVGAAPASGWPDPRFSGGGGSTTARGVSDIAVRHDRQRWPERQTLNARRMDVVRSGAHGPAHLTKSIARREEPLIEGGRLVAGSPVGAGAGRHTKATGRRRRPGALHAPGHEMLSVAEIARQSRSRCAREARGSNVTLRRRLGRPVSRRHAPSPDRQ
jgi:hypothetical protein